METPVLQVLITPQFEDGHATGLQIILTIGCSKVEEGSTIVEFSTIFEDVLIEGGLLAFNEHGILPLIQENDCSALKWNAARKSLGDVKIDYRVSSSSSDEF